MAMLFRESMLINGIMTNSEIWYNLSKNEIEEFESLDRLFFRRLIEVPITTPSESYYWELGVLPVSTIIKAIRLNYLHTILKMDKKGMVYSFFTTQWNSPSKGDWTEQIKEDLNDFKIPCSFDFITSKSDEAFKTLVKKCAKIYTMEHLQKQKLKHSKMDNLSYSDLKMQSYFTGDQISTSEKKMLFRVRTRMEKFGDNYRGGKEYVMCPLCKLHLDNQDLCLQCPEVVKEIKCRGELREIY